MQAHIIEDGIVVNTIEVLSLDALAGVDLVDASLGGKIGDSLVEGEFVSPEPPVPPVPERVTRRQALSALLISGVTVAMIEAAIAGSGMNALQQGLALIELHESLEFERDRPLVISIGAAMSLDLDELFTLAGSL